MSQGISSQDEEALFRQLAVYGHEAQSKLMKMRVYLHGMTGLGVEVAKNLILAGPKAVTIFDPKTVEPRDLGANFYLNEKHIGTATRAQAVLPQLKQLNQNVNVSESTQQSPQAIVQTHDCVVILDSYDRPFLTGLSELCHQQGKAFVYGGNLGLYGFAFVDFGEKHVVFDGNGEPETLIHISGISRDTDGTVILHEDARHNLTDGDVVTFNEVRGMVEVNKKLFKVSGLNKFGFKIGDTTAFGEYLSGGAAVQVKVPLEMKFNSLAKSLSYPFAPGSKELPSILDFQKFGVSEQLHEILNGVLLFHSKHSRLPEQLSQADASQLLRLVKEYQSSKMTVEGEEFSATVDDRLVQDIAMYGRCQISPCCSFWGGVITQEIIKLTGKYTPLRQWLHHEFFDIVDREHPRTVLPNRYQDYTVLFGDQLVSRLRDSSVLLIGAGALGCEYLKMLGLMGVSCGGGRTVCADDDNIEMSNLNRQFLFRKNHIGQNKCKIATGIAQSINPEFQAVACQTRVSSDNEEIFDEKFFEILTCVVNAVDNVDARKYIDNRCVESQRPLFESGTLGTKCHSQVILPKLTQSYNDIRDPEEVGIPLCTLKNFPYQIDHAIQWARDYFEGVIVEPSSNLAKFFQNRATLLENIVSQNRMNPSEARLKLESILNLYHAHQEHSYARCVQLGVDLFQFAFDHQIEQLVFCYPEHCLDSEHKKPFWSGTKRFPHAIKFNPQDELTVSFIEAAANIFADIFKIPRQPRAEVVLLARKAVLKPFAPKNIKIDTDEKKKTMEVEYNPDDELEVKHLLEKLNGLPLTGATPQAIAFEKDNSTNFHIQFVGGVSNLRARNYHIEEVDNFKVKLIAGKIIPAIATTTAAIVGLVGLEIIKYVLGRGIDSFREVTMNLALPMWVFSDPTPPIMFRDKQNDIVMGGPVCVAPGPFSKWEKIEIAGPLTLAQLKQRIESTYQLTVEMITYGSASLFSCMFKGTNMEQTVQERILKLTKTEIPKWRSSVLLGVSGKKGGVDCLMPDVKYIL